MKDAFCILQDSNNTTITTEDEDGSDVDSQPGEEETKDEIFARLQAEKDELDLPSLILFKRNSAIWKGVLRSKGFVWLATRTIVSGEWSQAGCMWTLKGGAPWMCTVNEEDWGTEDEELKIAIRSDFFGSWGDRRQESEFRYILLEMI